jgi:hypothetical protein
MKAARDRQRATIGKYMIPAVIDDLRLRELWACDDMTIMDIAWALDVFHREVIERARLLRLPKRPFMQQQNTPDPTEDEIAERAAAIRRARWSPEETEVRRVGPGAERWDVPTVSVRIH